MPLLLTEHDVRAVLPMPDLIDAMARALGEFSAGRVVQPVRSVLDIASEEAFFGVMPAALGTPPALGAKLVTVYPHNHARGLPSHLATIVLMDHATGALDAILDGRYITEARTAAVSAVSVKLLARRGASVLAIIGSGVQARSHLEAIRHVATLTDVRVWSPDAAHREHFAHEATVTSSLPVRATSDVRTAVRGADLVVLATSSREPVIASDDVAPGTHVCGVGACRPDQREMPTALISRARVYVDSRAAALKESGDLLLPIKEGAITDRHIVGELGELAAGKVPGRIAASGVTIFKSLGLAVEDVVAARLAVERARAAGLGKAIDLT
ncbi:MAG TPA: ornithine cyclodeaminase family protein [Vicinamibacterales bacterium]|nr:ornithine cyclodeaminase family protein [Vicinamibacterales bacterium]